MHALQFILPVSVYTWLLSSSTGSGTASTETTALLPRTALCHVGRQVGSNWSGTCMVHMGYICSTVIHKYKKACRMEE